MDKVLALFANVVGSAYFMGGMLIQHERARKLVDELDCSFTNTLLALKEKRLTETANLLAKLFGGVAAAAFICILLMSILNFKSPSLAIALFSIFGISGFLFGSLIWVLKHDEVTKFAVKSLLFFGGGSLLFPLMDIFTGIGFTNIVYTMMQTSFEPLFSLPDGRGLVYEAFIVVGVYSGCVILFYLMAWFYAVPVALLAFLIVAIPILGARAINHAFPEKPIAVVFFAMWLISLIYLTYA